MTPPPIEVRFREERYYLGIQEGFLERKYVLDLRFFCITKRKFLIIFLWSGMGPALAWRPEDSFLELVLPVA